MWSYTPANFVPSEDDEPTLPYWKVPFAEHSDFGFGGMAGTFKVAATTLQELVDKVKEPWPGNDTSLYLPIFFLYRHACELYFKSLIVLLYLASKQVERPPADQAAAFLEQIKIQVIGENGIKKSQALCTVHSLHDLLRGTNDSLKAWDASEEVSPEVWTWVERIENFDRKSDFFRYPFSRGWPNFLEKASFREVETLSGSGAFTILKNPQGEVVKRFKWVRDPHKDLTSAVRETAGSLEATHDRVRKTITGGW